MKKLSLMTILLMGSCYCLMPNCVSITQSSQESWSKSLDKPLLKLMLKPREYLLKMSFPKTCEAKLTRITEEGATNPVKKSQ
jgi:hypothetical protein